MLNNRKESIIVVCQRPVAITKQLAKRVQGPARDGQNGLAGVVPVKVPHLVHTVQNGEKVVVGATTGFVPSEVVDSRGLFLITIRTVRAGDILF